MKSICNTLRSMLCERISEEKNYGLQEVPVTNSTLNFSKEGGETKFV